MPDKRPKAVVRDWWVGAARIINPADVKIEYPGARPEKLKTERDPATGKFVRAVDGEEEPVPALTGPVLPNPSDWYAD